MAIAVWRHSGPKPTFSSVTYHQKSICHDDASSPSSSGRLGRSEGKEAPRTPEHVRLPTQSCIAVADISNKLRPRPRSSTCSNFLPRHAFSPRVFLALPRRVRFFSCEANRENLGERGVGGVYQVKHLEHAAQQKPTSTSRRSGRTGRDATPPGSTLGTSMHDRCPFMQVSLLDLG